MNFSKQLKEIRNAENVSRKEFCEETGIPFKTMEKYEQGISSPGGESLRSITTHSRYSKYTLWLMTGQTAPEAGQVCPEFINKDTTKKISDSTSSRKKA
ncbi:helix-turn-helix domain-containing protein [Photobacterium carnosum]|uniref:helix-turn-helix domain-containing protein n=1 Tax=Photobacterium carnosum TaxID=2023717 RepID=UPI00242AE3C6|nr:helix-turn-helix transcriptional regulator [Photobacterium carnosum]